MLLHDQRIDPSANNSAALVSACEYGHAKIVKMLLKVFSISSFDLPTRTGGLILPQKNVLRFKRQQRKDTVKLYQFYYSTNP